MGNESRVIYVWDTNVFIDLKKRYPEDRFPTLWNKIRELTKEGRIRIHEKVLEELKNYGKRDEAYNLAEELRKFRKGTSVPITEYQLNKIPEILDKLRQIGGKIRARNLGILLINGTKMMLPTCI